MNNKKNLILVSLSQLISRIGDTVFDIVLLLYVAKNTVGILGITTTSFVYLVITSFASILIGVVIDKFPKKMLMLISSFASAILMMSLFIINIDSKSFSSVSIAILLGLYIGLNNLFNNLFRTCGVVYNSQILSKDKFTKIQTSLDITYRVIGIVCIILTSYLFKYIEFNSVILFNFITFLISGVMLIFLKSNFVSNINKVKEKSHHFKIVITELTHDRSIILFIAMLSILNLSYVIVPEILPLTIIKQFSGDTGYFGLFKTAVILGEVIAFIYILKNYNKKFHTLIVFGFVLSAISFVVLTQLTSLYLVIAFFFIFSFSDTLTQPVYNIFISEINEKIRGTIMGISNFIVLGFASLGILLFNITYALSYQISILLLSVPIVLGLLIYLIYNKNKLHDFQSNELLWFEKIGYNIEKKFKYIKVSNQNKLEDFNFIYYYNNKNLKSTRRLTNEPLKNADINFIIEKKFTFFKLDKNYSNNVICIKSSDSGNYKTYKIYRGDLVVGSVSLLYAFDFVGVYNFAVYPQHSGQEIEEQVLELLNLEISASLFIQTRQDNKAAIKIYSKSGFKIHSYYNYF